MAVTAQTSTEIDSYETLLLGYAAGVLDQAQSLIVASHIALSPQARDKVSQCEALGGALMEKYCEPVAMRRDSLMRCLDKLDKAMVEETEELYELVFPEGLSIPLCLKRTVACQPTRVHWHKLKPGIETFELHLECKQSHTLFMKADRGVQGVRVAPRAMELTLVLDGALYDKVGPHKRGDLVIADEDCPPESRAACRQHGGFYMVVTSGHGKRSLLNPLMRFFLKYD